eukprot:Awhi_evm1s8281
MFLILDYIIGGRTEFLLSYFYTASTLQSISYRGYFEVSFTVSASLLIDILCFIFIPNHILLLLAACFVWGYLVYDVASFFVPPIVMWFVCVYVEVAYRHDMALSIICKPLAAHCVGFPLLSIAFHLSEYITQWFEKRKRDNVVCINATFYNYLNEAKDGALPEDLINSSSLSPSVSPLDNATTGVTANNSFNNLKDPSLFDGSYGDASINNQNGASSTTLNGISPPNGYANNNNANSSTSSLNSNSGNNNNSGSSSSGNSRYGSKRRKDRNDKNSRGSGKKGGGAHNNNNSHNHNHNNNNSSGNNANSNSSNNNSNSSLNNAAVAKEVFDGRKYSTSDFPELADYLTHTEKIAYLVTRLREERESQLQFGEESTSSIREINHLRTLDSQYRTEIATLRQTAIQLEADKEHLVAKIQEAKNQSRKKDENYRQLKRELEKEQRSRASVEQSLKLKLESKKSIESELQKKNIKLQKSLEEDLRQETNLAKSWEQKMLDIYKHKRSLEESIEVIKQKVSQIQLESETLKETAIAIEENGKSIRQKVGYASEIDEALNAIRERNASQTATLEAESRFKMNLNAELVRAKNEIAFLLGQQS